MTANEVAVYIGIVVTDSNSQAVAVDVWPVMTGSDTPSSSCNDSGCKHFEVRLSHSNSCSGVDVGIVMPHSDTHAVAVDVGIVV